MSNRVGKEANEQLQRYFDGELAADERARVEASLSEDDQLRLAALSEIRGLTANTLLTESAEIDLWPALEKRLAAEQARPRRRWGLRAHPGSWSAGMMAAAAAALLLLFQPWHAGSENDCDVESLETSGGMATVFNLNNTPHGPTTVIWTEEQD